MFAQYSTRLATPEDIPTLVKHRRWMFDEISIRQNRNYQPPDLEKMDKAYHGHLVRHLREGDLFAWVVDYEGKIVASGAVSILPWPPLPNDITECASHLHSMWTDPEHRGKGLARRIVETAMAFCQERGIQWMMLAASDAGRPIYKSMGFHPAERYMIKSL